MAQLSGPVTGAIATLGPEKSEGCEQSSEPGDRRLYGVEGVELCWLQPLVTEQGVRQ